MPPRKAAKGRRAILLWGQEELRKREALEALLDELVPPEDRDLNVQYIDATNSGVTGEMILHAARDRAMFSERRVVVVQNAGRLRGQRHQRTQEVLAEGIPSLPEYSTLILVAYAEEGEGRSRSPFGEKLTAAARAHGEVRSFASLKPDEIARLVTEEAAAGGKKLTPAAASQIAQRVGTDSRRALQEVRKLVLFVGDRPAISPQDVAELVPAPPDDNIFHLLDAAVDGDRGRALSLLRQVRESGAAVPQVLALLGGTLRQIAQAKYLQEQGISPSVEGDAVPAEVLEALPRDGSLYASRGRAWLRERRLWPAARRISWGQLQRALDRLAITDAGMKGWEQGIEDPDLAAEVFVIALCETVRPAGRPAPAPARRGYG